MCALCCVPTGAGVGEGNTYQRVNVYDGSSTVGSLDYMVHQAVSLSFSLLVAGHYTSQSMYIRIYVSHV